MLRFAVIINATIGRRKKMNKKEAIELVKQVAEHQISYEVAERILDNLHKKGLLKPVRHMKFTTIEGYEFNHTEEGWDD